MDPLIKQHYQKAKEYEAGIPYVKVNFGDKQIHFNTPNEKCSYFALSINQREPKTNEWISTFDENDVFFDIGANNGIYGLLAAVLMGCRVYAFEPHFGSYYVMCLNIYSNNLQNRMFAYPIAMSDHEGYGELYLSATYAGKSLNNFGESRPHSDPLWNATIPQAAITTNLDLFVARTGVIPNHIKVDVDGIEPAIVNGARMVLSDPRLKSIMIELDMKDPEHMAVFEKLSAHGFRRYETDEAGVFFYR